MHIHLKKEKRGRNFKFKDEALVDKKQKKPKKTQFDSLFLRKPDVFMILFIRLFFNQLGHFFGEKKFKRWFGIESLALKVFVCLFLKSSERSPHM